MTEGRPYDELAARMKDGNLAVLEDAYQQHASRLYNLARRMLGERADAEDALQDVFLHAFRKLDGFKGESSLGTWLYRLAMNLLLDRLRSRTAKNDRVTDSLDAVPTSSSGLAGGGDLAPTRIDLERAIAGLPPGARAAFLLHDVEGFEHREVGEILGISEGTSKSQVHKARLRIREFLIRRPAPVER